MTEDEARHALQVAMDALKEAPALRAEIAKLGERLRWTQERLWKYNIGVGLLLAEMDDDAPRIMDAVRDRPWPADGDEGSAWQDRDIRAILRVPMDFDAPIGVAWDPRKKIPAGEGYQLWWTGTWTPITPSCESVEALARWRSTHPDGTDADWTPYAAWLAEFEWLASRPPPVRLAW